jgi:hypothetical protein
MTACLSEEDLELRWKELQQRAHDASVRYLLTDLKVAFTLLTLADNACERHSALFIESARRTYASVVELSSKLTIDAFQRNIILGKMTRLHARLEEFGGPTPPTAFAMPSTAPSGRTPMSEEPPSAPPRRTNNTGSGFIGPLVSVRS